MKRYLMLFIPTVAFIIYLFYISPKESYYPQEKLKAPDCIIVDFGKKQLSLYPTDKDFKAVYHGLKATWWNSGEGSWENGYYSDSTCTMELWNQDEFNYEGVMVKFLYDKPFDYRCGIFEGYRATQVTGYLFLVEESAYIPIEEGFKEKRIMLTYLYGDRINSVLVYLKEHEG